MHPRVLIVGTVPYNTKSTSRAFDAYFRRWEHENLAQIFSNPKTPCKGHCGTLYQITDRRMLRRWLDRGVETGRIFQRETLPEMHETVRADLGGTAKLYRLGARHTPLTHLMRGALWRKRFWCTPELSAWLDAFRPECVFLAFSDDYFIPRIALYVAKRFDIPIVSCIGDDYYFNTTRTLDPFYHLYKSTYRRLIDRVLGWPGSAIYISDKIRDKYNAAFGLDGETVYLTSGIRRRAFSPVNTDSPVVTYFGNVRMGRNLTLCAVARALRAVNPSCTLEVYSTENDEAFLAPMRAEEGLDFRGSVPYAEVERRMGESDVTVIVEGFRPEDVAQSRYSLSTKAADALASGSMILACGAQDCGIIEYMQSTHAALVCTAPEQIESALRRLFGDAALQRRLYDAAVEISAAHHTPERSCSTAEGVIERAIRRGTKGGDHGA